MWAAAKCWQPNASENMRNWLHQPNIIMPNLPQARRGRSDRADFISGVSPERYTNDAWTDRRGCSPATPQRPGWTGFRPLITNESDCYIIFTTLSSSAWGGIEALLMRMQLAWPGNTFLIRRCNRSYQLLVLFGSSKSPVQGSPSYLCTHPIIANRLCQTPELLAVPCLSH